MVGDGGGNDNDSDNNDDIDDYDNGTMTMWCDGRPAMRRTLTNPAPPIQGNNNQLMWTVWEEGNKSEWQYWGKGGHTRSRWRRLGGDHLNFTQLIPNLSSGHPSAEKGPESIPHVSWEWGCTIGAMGVSMFYWWQKVEG